MKTWAIKAILRLFRYIGVRKAIKLVWSYYIYPKLAVWTKSNQYPEWDEKVLEWVNTNIYRAIDEL